MDKGDQDFVEEGWQNRHEKHWRESVAGFDSEKKAKVGPTAVRGLLGDVWILPRRPGLDI